MFRKRLIVLLTLLLTLQNLFWLSSASAATLPAPTNVKIYQYYPGNVTLTWDNVTGAGSYRIYRLAGDQKTLAAEVPYTELTGTVYSLPEGIATFAVAAVRLGVESPLSNALSIDVIYPEMQPPLNLKYSIISGNDVTVTWNTYKYAASYNIYRNDNGQRTLISTTKTNSYTISNHPEGTYDYEITSYNSRFGESAYGTHLQVNVTYPVMQPPVSTYSIVNGNDIAFNWQRFAYATSYKVYEVLNGSRSLLTSTIAPSYTLTNVSEGPHTYEITSVSSRYGESQSASRHDIDLVYPKMQAPQSFTSTITNFNEVSLRWSQAEYATAYKVYQIVNGERKLVYTSAALNWPMKNLAEGHYIYEVNAYSDRFGESENAARVEFDIRYPVIQPPINLKVAVQNGNDLYLTWSPADYATSYKVYQVVDGVRQLVATKLSTSNLFLNMPEGHYHFEVKSVSDRFGESTTASSIEYDLIYPVILTPSLTGTVVQNKDIVLSWTKSDSATGYNIYQIVNGVTKNVATTTSQQFNFINKPPGDYVFGVTAYHTKFGESPLSNEVPLTIIDTSVPPAPVDNTPPVTVAIPSAEYSKTDITVQLNATDNMSGVYKTYYSIDGSTKSEGTSFTVSDEGKHTIEYYSVDNAGNIETSKTLEIGIDRTAPVTVTEVGNDWYNQDVVIALTAADSVSGVDKTFYSLDGLAQVEANALRVATDGIHSLSFYSIDKVGNTEQPVTVDFKIDKTAPVTVSKFGDDRQNLTVELTPSDNLSGVAKTFYSIDDAAFVEGNSLILPQTATKLSYYSVDLAGNMEEAKTVDLQLDKTPPVTTSNITDAWLNADFAVTLTASDDQSGVDKTFYSINGGTDIIGTSFTIDREGVTAVTYYSVDKAGNIELEKTAEVKIDKTAPVTTADVTNGWSQRAVHLSALDELSGVDKTFYSINGAPYVEGKTFNIEQEGLNTISFYSVDKAGNKEAVKTVEVNIDVTPPVTVSNAPADWVQSDVAIQLTATDNLSGVDKTFYSIDGGDFVEGTAFSIAQEGIHTISFYSIDKAGNKETTQSVNVKIDKTAPVTTSNAVDTWLKQDIVLTANDAVSGVEKTFYSINGSAYVEGTNVPALEEGIHSVAFYSIDKAGNKEEAKTIEVKVDVTPPVTSTLVPQGWQKNSVELQLTATDNLSGVDKTFYSVNGSAFVEGTGITVDQEGANRVSFYSIDKAGNKEETKTVEVNIDRTAPETQSNVTEGWTNQDVSVKLTATDAISGVDHTYYSINGGAYTEGTSFTIDQEGTSLISYYSVDKAGNTEQAKTVEVKLDKTPPTTVTNIGENWVKNDTTVELTALDNLSGVDKTFYSINGQGYVEGLSFVLTQTGVTRISYYSVDKAGNTEEAKTVEFKIDNTPPVTISNATDNWLKDDFAVELTATDDLSGVDKTFYSINGNVNVEGSRFTLTQEGINKISFYSVDKAGNTETANTAEVKIDKTAPVVAWNLSDEYVLGDKVTVSYNASDAVSGVAEEKLTVNGTSIANGDTVTLGNLGTYTFRLTVTDHAGWTTTLEKTIKVTIPVTLEVLPNVINDNKGIFTVRVILPAGLDPSQIDLSTVRLNGVAPILDKNGKINQGEKGQFKFNRSDFTWNEKEKLLEFHATLNGYQIVGQKTVKVQIK